MSEEIPAENTGLYFCGAVKMFTTVERISFKLYQSVMKSIAKPREMIALIYGSKYIPYCGFRVAERYKFKNGSEAMFKPLIQKFAAVNIKPEKKSVF